jgi:hypothetical protein
MREHDLPAKYLVLPPNIDIKDIVIEVNTKRPKSSIAENPSTTGRALNSSGRHAG